jgi:cytochrome c oxidase subunit 4
MEALRPVLVPILLTLSAAKFTMVVGFFMHLKFDSKLYRALFVGPLVVAIAVMMAMFLLYGVLRG